MVCVIARTPRCTNLFVSLDFSNRWVAPAAFAARRFRKRKPLRAAGSETFSPRMRFVALEGRSTGTNSEARRIITCVDDIENVRELSAAGPHLDAQH